MDPGTILIATLFFGAVALKLCAVAAQARAAPKLVFATLGGGTCEVTPNEKAGPLAAALITSLTGGDCQPLGPPALLAPVWRGFASLPPWIAARRPTRNGGERVSAVVHNDNDADTTEGEVPGGKRQSVGRVRRVEGRIYVELLDSFEACKSRDHARMLQFVLQAKYPGHQELVRRAYREMYGS